MAGRKKAEEEFRLKVASNPEWDKAYGDAWDTIADVVKKMTPLAKQQILPSSFRLQPGRLCHDASFATSSR